MTHSGHTITAGTARQVLNADATPGSTEFLLQVFGKYAEHPRWVEWNAEDRSPLMAGTTKPADVTNPDQWTTADGCDPRRAGIVFTGDGLGGVDLDGCRDPRTGAIAEWAQELIDRFNSYTEVSPSGTGVKIFAAGAPSPKNWPHKTMPMPGPRILIPGSSKSKAPAIEAYVIGRHFTVTGNSLHTPPRPIREAPEAWAALGEQLAQYRQTTHRSDLSLSGRNGWLTSQGFSMRAKNVPEEEIRAALFELNRTATAEDHPNFEDGPLDEREVEKIVRSVLSVPAGQESPFLSDEFMAGQVAARFGDRLKHVHGWGWMWNEGPVWVRDEARHNYRCVRTTCRDQAKSVKKEHLARSICSNPRYAAINSVLKSHERIVAMADEFDADDWQLNTPGGVVDLRTGQLVPHWPDHRFTKIAAVAPDPDQPTPVWNRFIDRITDGDKELQAYLQRLGGYCLTGSTREEMLAFLWGEGQNGKTKFVETLAGILNSYHEIVATTVLLQSRFDQHPTGLATLAGARLVTADETDEGRSWNESIVKSLTGGGTITARFIGQDFFKFKPKFKLIVAGNSKPNLLNVDKAWQRRLHIVPFSVVIPDEERDVNLAFKLSKEWPGILHWLVQGCLAWQREGLAPPKAVREASESYLQDQDTFGDFLIECVTKMPGLNVRASHLFAAYEGFCKARGMRSGHVKLFNEKMQSRGYSRKRTNEGWFWEDVTISENAFDAGYLDRLSIQLDRNAGMQANDGQPRF